VNKRSYEGAAMIGYPASIKEKSTSVGIKKVVITGDPTFMYGQRLQFLWKAMSPSDAKLVIVGKDLKIEEEGVNNIGSVSSSEMFKLFMNTDIVI